MLIINVFVAIVIVGLFAAAVAFFDSSKKAKNVVSSSNPIDGLQPGGTMGFMLGDSYAFCKSRFKHLNLSVSEDGFESDTYKIGLSSYRDQYVIWGSEFENIEEVCFCFGTDKVLKSISISMDYSKMGKKDMYGILVSRISRVLGIEPMMCLDFFSKWCTSKSDISLSIYPNSYCQGVKDSVTIQILP